MRNTRILSESENNAIINNARTELRGKYERAIIEAHKNNDDEALARLEIGLARTYMTADMLALEIR